ncbi:MAG: anti-sigma factor [Chitinophagaceae bacterium]|nr:anti-sigma factor [Chitinophagaceae bacterium]
MELQVYIESGVIESYVLGIADPEEILEVDRMKEQYPEVQQAIDEFSIAIEEQAFKNAVEPPEEIKQQLLSSFQFHHPAKSNTETPLLVAYKSTVDNETPNISSIPSITNWKYLAAASIVLFVVSATANLLLYNRYTSTKSQYVALINERNSLQANNQVYQTKLRDYQSATEMMADPSVAMVQLKDPAHKKDNMATVFWDKKTKDVYLLTNKLPAPNTNQQYQLWALVDGKPVDAGMLDPLCTSLCKMKNIPLAQAFAITLEKVGGSPVPTMDQLFVMGNI